MTPGTAVSSAPSFACRCKNSLMAKLRIAEGSGAVKAAFFFDAHKSASGSVQIRFDLAQFRFDLLYSLVHRMHQLLQRFHFNTQ